MNAGTPRRGLAWPAAAVLLTASSVAGWTLGFDGSSFPGTAVLGGYRDRVFLTNVALSWAALAALWVALCRPARGTCLRVGALHLALLLALGLLELPAALGIVDYRAMFATAQRASLPDPRLGRVTAPAVRFEGGVSPDLVDILGAAAAPVVVRFETDRYGLRNARDKSDPAVVCLGDSVLVAGLLPIEQVVTERLEAALGKEVLNVSESGLCPEEELIRFERTGIEPRGRLFVQFLFEGNDLADLARWRSGRDNAGAWPESGVVKSVLRRLHGPRLEAGRRRVATFRAADGPADVWFLYDHQRIGRDRAEWPHLEESIRAARDRFAAAGASYAVALVPCKLTTLRDLCDWPADSTVVAAPPEEDPWRPALERVCASEGIPFLDLTPALRAVAARGALPFFPADTHPNAAGHAAMSEALAVWIERVRPH